MSNKYGWRAHSNFHVDATTAGQELERIAKKNGGLEPRTVVKEAEPEEAPLHPAFPWDNDEAGPLYREYVARNLIKSVRRVIDDGDTQPVYVSVARILPDEEPDQPPRVYKPLVEVVTNKDDLASAVAHLTAKLESARQALDDVKRAMKEGSDQETAVLAGITEALVTARILAASL